MFVFITLPHSVRVEQLHGSHYKSVCLYHGEYATVLPFFPCMAWRRSRHRWEASMTNQDIIAQADQVIIKTYGRYPVAFCSRSGSTVWDADGKSYTDFLSGLRCVLGHCHPRWSRLSPSRRRHCYTSRTFTTLCPKQKATFLLRTRLRGKVFFCNSGAEANERQR
jgi:4-aminobutyrate aminotransferase-like enzyme